jgi:hypothetical protein
MYPTNDLVITRPARDPIQCEGIKRGPERMAEVAVSGSVNPQLWYEFWHGVSRVADWLSHLFD